MKRAWLVGVVAASLGAASLSSMSALAASAPDPAPAFVPEACRGRALDTRPPVRPRSAAAGPKAKTLTRATRQALFTSLAQTVRARYLDPTFGGRDWAAVEARYRAMIAKGVSTTSYYAAVERFVKELGDNHSYFQSPAAVAAAARASTEVQGDASFAGIGVYADSVPEGLVVLSTIGGSPAAASGIAARDLILSVDGIPGIHPQARTTFRGPPCSVAVLSVATPGDAPRRVSVVRADVAGRPAVDVRIVVANNGARVAYVMFPTFLDPGLPVAIRSALEALGPVDGLIVDERLNGGGSGSVLQAMLAMFTGGPMGEFVRRDGRRPLAIEPAPVHASQSAPLAVIVGPRTVSYGEVFAGIVQDSGRGKIVGTRSKGNVETLNRYDGSDGSRLWLAAERFEPRVSKANWEGVGIIPDVEVSGGWHAFRLEDDPAVNASLKLLFP